MIERHITFNVHPDQVGEFERFFVDVYRPAMATTAGYTSAALLREVESATRYQMVLRFADADSSAGWRNSELHASLQPDLLALYADNEIQGYEVIA